MSLHIECMSYDGVGVWCFVLYPGAPAMVDTVACLLTQEFGFPKKKHLRSSFVASFLPSDDAYKAYSGGRNRAEGVFLFFLPCLWQATTLRLWSQPADSRKSNLIWFRTQSQPATQKRSECSHDTRCVCVVLGTAGKRFDRTFWCCTSKNNNHPNQSIQTWREWVNGATNVCLDDVFVLGDGWMVLVYL